MLDKKINSKNIQRKNIYIYLGGSGTGENKNTENDTKEIAELFELYADISKYTNEIISIGEENFSRDNAKDELLLSLLKNYNKKIICSSLIRNNYPYIHELYEHLATKYKSEIEEIKSYDNITFYDYFAEGAKYRSNFDNVNTFDRKTDAYENGLRANSFASFNILVLLDYFTDSFNINLKNKILYPHIKIGRGTRTKEINYQNVMENKKKVLDSYYPNAEKKSNLFILVRKLVYFICMVYPILFDIDSETSEVKDYLPNRKLHELLDSVQVKINRIIKITNYENKIDINSISLDVKENLMKLLGHIINKY